MPTRIGLVGGALWWAPDYGEAVLPPGLSMLWESAEPGQALQERFGFDDLGSVSEWVAVVLRRAWGVNVTDVSRVLISDHNAIAWVRSERGDLVVKWSCAEPLFPRLDVTTRVLSTLGARGLPVATPLPAPDGRVRVVRRGPRGPLSVVVLPELLGEWLDVADDRAVRSAGACLAELHAVLADVPDDHLPPGTRTSTSRTQIRCWLDEEGHRLPADAATRLAELLTDLPEPEDRPQPVHQDYRAANLLVRDAEVVGVLDLDELGIGHRLHDLAHAGVHLATRFTDWGPTPASAQQQLRDGYESVRPLSEVEHRWWDVLVLYHGLRAFPPVTGRG